MSDRINALTVIMTEPIHEDDAQALINAIKQLRGVGDVQTHVASLSDAIAYSRARNDIGKRLLEVIYPEATDRT